MFECKGCDKEFPTKILLMRHKETIH